MFGPPSPHHAGWGQTTIVVSACVALDDGVYGGTTPPPLSEEPGVRPRGEVCCLASLGTGRGRGYWRVCFLLGMDQTAGEYLFFSSTSSRVQT